MSASEKDDEVRDQLIVFFNGLSSADLQALKKVSEELMRARELHPTWPEDSIYQAAIVQEEAGELIRAALQHELDDEARQPMETEAVQTAAMALRFLLKG